MKPVDRFIGHGNTAVGDKHRPIKAWRLVCGNCGDESIVGMPGAALPPEKVFRKFISLGWYIGRRAADDRCWKCRNETAPKAANKPEVVASDNERLRAENANMKLRLSKLERDHRDEIAVIRRAQTAAEESRLTAAAGAIRLEDLRGLLRRVHELLINDCAVEAQAAIEASAPEWPWPRRLPKIKGSLAPKATPLKDDKGFDQWLDQLNREQGRQ